jgi:polysaccharide pyruvyl transferase WcaK-like protein
MQAVVGTRYHNVVGALLAGRPAVAVAYSEKHRALLADYGLEAHAHDILELDADRLEGSLRTVIADRERISASVGARTAAGRTRLHGQLDALFAEVLPASAGAPAAE